MPWYLLPKQIEERCVVLAQRGFTLVELVAVLVLIALLAVSTMVKVNQPLHQVASEQALSEFQFLDALARDRAQQEQGVRLVLDTKRQTATLFSANGAGPLGTCRFSKSCRLFAVLGVPRLEPGRFYVNYDSFGTSESYALQLEVAKNSELYLLVLGLTGQTNANLSRNEVIEILHSGRTDSG